MKTGMCAYVCGARTRAGGRYLDGDGDGEGAQKQPKDQRDLPSGVRVRACVRAQVSYVPVYEKYPRARSSVRVHMRMHACVHHLFPTSPPLSPSLSLLLSLHLPHDPAQGPGEGPHEPAVGQVEPQQRPQVENRVPSHLLFRAREHARAHARLCVCVWSAGDHGRTMHVHLAILDETGVHPAAGPRRDCHRREARAVPSGVGAPQQRVRLRPAPVPRGACAVPHRLRHRLASPRCCAVLTVWPRGHQFAQIPRGNHPSQDWNLGCG